MSKEQKAAYVAVIQNLANIISVTGEKTEIDGKTGGKLVLVCADSDKPDVTTNIEITLGQFDAIYKGMVKCWPAIKPLKDEIAIAQRTETKAEATAAREAAKLAKTAESEAAKALAKAERERLAKEKADLKQAEKDAAKAQREAAAATAKATKEAEALAKKKADTEKATKAATAIAAGAKPVPGKDAAKPDAAKPAAVKPATKPDAVKK